MVKLSLEKVRLSGLTVPSVVSLLLTSITIFSPGRVKRETVKVALSPAVEGVPESVLKTILGVFLGDDSEVSILLAGSRKNVKNI